MFDLGLGCLLGAGIYIIGYALSWVITCALITLVCMCFGWTFSLATATGIWLVMVIASLLFKK